MGCKCHCLKKVAANAAGNASDNGGVVVGGVLLVLDWHLMLVSLLVGLNTLFPFVGKSIYLELN